MCTMRPLAEVLATDAGGARKKISQLVDGIENGAKISGSPRRQRRVKRKEKRFRKVLTEAKSAVRCAAHSDASAAEGQKGKRR
jgi:hypothetical protein